VWFIWYYKLLILFHLKVDVNYQLLRTVVMGDVTLTLVGSRMYIVIDEDMATEVFLFEDMNESKSGQ